MDKRENDRAREQKRERDIEGTIEGKREERVAPQMPRKKNRMEVPLSTLPPEG